MALLRRLADVVEIVHDLAVESGVVVEGGEGASPPDEDRRRGEPSPSPPRRGQNAERRGKQQQQQQQQQQRQQSRTVPSVSERLAGNRPSPPRQAQPQPPAPIEALGVHLRGLRALFKRAVEPAHPLLLPTRTE